MIVDSGSPNRADDSGVRGQHDEALAELVGGQVSSLESCLGLDLPRVEGSVRRCHTHEEQPTVPHGEEATGPHPGEEGLDHDVVEGVQTLWQDGHDPDMDVLDHCTSEFVGIRRLGPVVGTLTGWLGDRTPVPCQREGLAVQV